MVLCSAWKRLRRPLPAPAAWLLTFGFVNVAWVLFRAPSWARALQHLRAMTGGNGIVLFSQLEPILGPLKRIGVEFRPLDIPGIDKLLAYIGAAFVIGFWPRNSNVYVDDRHAVSPLVLAAVAVLAAISVLNLDQLSEFIYFNF
jgi:hypothetical protein